MKIGKIVLFLILSALFLTPVTQVSSKEIKQESPAQKASRMKWWNEATFGMFIHWGIYSVPGGVYHGKPQKGAGEWIMNDAHIPVDEYEQFAGKFNPVKFDAREWVRIAKEGGVKYIVITTKHHDGFALWNSKVSNYNVVEATPFHRDIIRELSDECRRQGIHFGTYYSIMDWRHPDATPRNSGTSYNSFNNSYVDKSGKSWSNYRDNFMIPQLTELVKNYNTELFWFDGEWIANWTEEQGKDLYNYLRSLDNKLIINNRVGKGRQGMMGMSSSKEASGDFGTPEQEILSTKTDEPWESCMTMNDTWGYKIHDQNWKSATKLIHNLIDIAAKGGNYLLNVGPDSEGLIPQASVERFAEMGKWLRVNGEAIYATSHKRNDYKEGTTYFTTKGNYLYLIVTQLKEKEITIKSVTPGKNGKITLLGSDEKISWRPAADGTGITITLPGQLPNPHALVFKMKGE